MGNVLFSYDGYMVNPTSACSASLNRRSSVDRIMCLIFLVFCIICGYLLSLMLLFSEVDIIIIIIIII